LAIVLSSYMSSPKYFAPIILRRTSFGSFDLYMEKGAGVEALAPYRI